MSNKYNSRDKDQALTVRQSNLPEVYAPSELIDILDRTRYQMESKTLVTDMTIHAISRRFVQSAMDELSATEKIEIFKQLYAKTMTPEVEASLHKLRENLSVSIEEISNRFALEMIAELQHSYRDLDNGIGKSFSRKLDELLKHRFTISFSLKD